jgi:uncharacterized SAM-dependent methyltransferase
MGMHQYSDHAGMRDGKSMSGARLWAEAEAEREAAYRNGVTNKMGAELALIQEVAAALATYIPQAANLIELGPGTLHSFRHKTMPLLRALKSPQCLIIDKSPAFLKDIKISEAAVGVSIVPIEEDFFLGKTLHQIADQPVLVCAFGGIISNLIAPLSAAMPTALLTSTLHKFALTIRHGWLLIAFDSSADPQEITAYYAKHALFQLNIFDRMQVELPMSEAFDPTAFDYVPHWNAAAHQLGHMAVLNRDLDFTIDAVPIALKKGQVLHLKNSYKFPDDFFEQCCAKAALPIVQSWQRDTARAYLLRKDAPTLR